MAYGTSLRKGTTVVDVARLQPVGPHAEAGDDGRPQLRRRQRVRPRGRVAAGHPLPRALAPGRRRAVGAPAPRRPRERGRALLRLRPAPTSPRTPSARSSASSNARTTAGCCPRRSATSPSRPAPSRTTPSPSRAPIDIDAIVARRFKLVVDHGYGATSFVMPNVLAKLGADVLSVNPYASTGGIDRTSTAPAPASGSPAWCVASGAHLGAVFDPDGERLVPGRRRGRRPEPTTSRCWRSSSSCRGHLLGDRIALPVTATAHAGRLAAAHGVHVRETKVSARRAGRRRHRAGRRLRRRRRGRLHPARLPAGVRRRRRLRQDARPAGPRAAASSPTCARRCRACTWRARRS